MASGFKFKISSPIPRNKEFMWRHMINMDMVNYELWPLIKMTYPKEVSTLQTVETGKTIFTSVLLLFGFIPFDLHWLALESYTINCELQEDSESLLQRFWRHRRVLYENGNDEVVIEDQIHFLPRLPFVGCILIYIVEAIFKHRHQRLRQLYPVK
jgi:ligand-binding SRPBCC domain-containing protein